MKERARQKFGELVERFRANFEVYKKSAYNETQVRREFIDPFFEALGWDVSNRQGFAEQYKEVVHEDALKIGRSTRAPDYSFRIGGQRKFFVEAKKPAVNVKEAVSPSYQLRRYAWSAKLPLSVVTDFEEFSVFDCRIKPSPKDKSSVGRIAYYTFEEYLESEKFDEIYEVFSKEAILKGSFDRYAQATKGKKGTAEVDSEFLKEIESWRELLAKNIALQNRGVSIYELNYAVQKLLDRIIFLRICEDRGIEPYGQLQTRVESGEVYTHLRNYFKLAEAKYDSGIFDFDADKITPALKIDDRVLRTVIQGLYYPKSPYEFSVLGVEILGNVYEQFLGKVIRLTAGHQAKVETKPEVKKAGGVYYTPQFIVDYIVKNSVGKLVAGKTPKEIAGIKILDPACGSGSFLIAAYSYLLNYHLDWYVRNLSLEKKALLKKNKKAVFQVREKEWYLTTAEKKRILRNNIFGVDIDPQAVEVTKLSLLLKVLEHESRESIDQQVKLGLEGVLPNLDGNVKCGNSLIGPDFYDSRQAILFNEEEMRRVNVFDWEDEVEGFGRILKNGGFDCVVGNPPWVSLKGKFRNDIHSENELSYLTRIYSGDSYRPNMYEYFVKKAISLTKPGGFHSFIVPDRFGFNKQFAAFRRELVRNGRIEELLYKAKFPYVIADTLIYRYRPGGSGGEAKGKSLCIIGEFHGPKFEMSQSEFLSIQDCQFLPISPVVKKIYSSNLRTVKLGQAVRTSVGFIAKSGQVKVGQVKVNPAPQAAQEVLKGRNVLKYYVQGNFYFSFKKENLAGGTQDEEKLGASPKILIRKTGYPLMSALDSTGRYPEQSLYFLYSPLEDIRLEYLLGIVNSSLFQYIYWNWMVTNRHSTPQLKKIHLDQFPVRSIDFANPSEKAQHDKLVSLVEKMLELQKKYHEARMERDKEIYERQIRIIDAQIDGLVYDLYGLTEEEVKVVEGEK